MGASQMMGELTLTGSMPTKSGAVNVLIRDMEGKALYATGTTVPTDATNGFAKGCLFVDTDVATGTTGLYVNVGTKASCVFKAVTNAS